MDNSTTPRERNKGTQAQNHTNSHQSDAASNAERLFNRDAERATNGAMLIDAAQIDIVRAVITGNDFEDRVNRKIAEAIFKVADDQKPVDLVSVGEELRKSGDDSFFPILEMSVSHCDAASKAPFYAAIVKNLSIAREAHALTQDAGRAIAGGQDTGQILDTLKNALDELQRSAPGKPSRFALMNREAIQALQPKKYLIAGMMEENSVGQLWGESGTGKTFVGLSMALHIAAGLAWHGRAVEAGAVVWCAGEGVQGLKKRIGAECIGKCFDWPEDFYLVAQPPQIASERDLSEFIRNVLPVNPRLVVLDTLSRHAVGLNENDQADMSRFQDAGARIARETGATVLFIHHANKQGKERGSTVIRGALDFNLEVRAERDAIMLFSDKAKDDGGFAPMVFTKRPIELPDGQTSLTLDRAAGDSLLPINRAEATRERVFEVLPDEGAKGSEWQEAAENAGICKSTKFYEYRDDLVKAGRVRIEKRIYKPVGEQEETA